MSQRLAELEYLVLLAIIRIGADSYGVTIAEALEESGRATSIGALYATLSRLEDKGLVSCKYGETTPLRGGKRKKLYQITGSGAMAVREFELVALRLSRTQVGRA